MYYDCYCTKSKVNALTDTIDAEIQSTRDTTFDRIK